MNIKITTIGCLLIFMLVTISFASAIETNTENEKKDSPLYRVRTKQAVREKIGKIIENIKVNLFGERIIYSPFQKLLTGTEAYTQQMDCTTDSGKICNQPIKDWITEHQIHSLCEWCTIGKYCS